MSHQAAPAIVLWEIMEFVVAESGTTGLQLTHRDTVTDLIESFLGGCVGALVAITAPWRGLVATTDE